MPGWAARLPPRKTNDAPTRPPVTHLSFSGYLCKVDKKDQQLRELAIQYELEMFANDVVDKLITSGNKNKAQRSIIKRNLDLELNVMLGKLKQQGLIHDFFVDVNDIDASYVSERAVPHDARPGDMLGSSGIIVSSDGGGNGVVLDANAPPGVGVKVKVLPLASVEYVRVHFVVAR